MSLVRVKNKKNASVQYLLKSNRKAVRLCLKAIERQYAYPAMKGSEDMLLLERNGARLKELCSSV
jgi:hypothetical protein